MTLQLITYTWNASTWRTEAVLQVGDQPGLCSYGKTKAKTGSSYFWLDNGLPLQAQAPECSWYPEPCEAYPDFKGLDPSWKCLSGMHKTLDSSKAAYKNWATEAHAYNSTI